MKHLVFAFAALLLPRVAAATVVSLPSDDELVSKSSVIGLAEVTRLTTFRDDKGQIRTMAELHIQRGVRGANTGDFLVVTYPGGIWNGYRSEVAGTPDLEVGKTVFAYLSYSNGEFHPVGFRYGVLNVARGKDGQLRATRRVDGLTFVGPRGDAMEPRVVDNVRVEEMITDIASRMKRLKIDPRVTVRSPNAVQVRQ